MRLRLIFPLTILLLLPLGICHAQVKPKPSLPGSAVIKSTPAYAEVLLRKTEVSAELESLLVEYTEEYPKVKDLRHEASLLQKEIDRLLAIPATDTFKLSAALGKLLVRKCEVATELWVIQKELNDEHPDVKRAKRKLEIFENAVVEILQSK